MKCRYCKGACIRVGIRKGIQRVRCKRCKKYQQLEYTYNVYTRDSNKLIMNLVKEGCGIRSISRLLEISRNTVMARILMISSQVKKPTVRKGKTYKMDELRTFLKRKDNERWVVYVIEKETGEVADFRVGRRSKKVLGGVVETLKLSEATRIYTDGFELYRYLIPESIHYKRPHAINHIERKNLSLRTHLKRLGRKTICFSRSLVMLEACLRIYFWG